MDVDISFGCPFICRFCFHLGLAGDLQYKETDGRTDVVFTYDRINRRNSPRYVVNMVKHMRQRFAVDYVLFMDEAGCSQRLDGLETFGPRMLRKVGKGATRKPNIRTVQLTMDAGIRPIPNQMIGFPDEFFDSILDCLDAWEEMGIMCTPFFAVPYPGSEWFNNYRDQILEQYAGNLEDFMLDIGDATRVTGNICQSFDAVGLYGVRELMVNRDVRRIKECAKGWQQRHGEFQVPDVRRAGAPRRSALHRATPR